MWVVCWRVRDKIGNGKPLGVRAASAWVKYGNSTFGPGTHWMVQVIEGGLTDD